MQKIKMLKNFKNLLWILAGNTLYALGVALFILPAGLITGGTTGLALFFRFQFHIPISAFVLIFNVAMFLTGLAVLGKRFALTTLVSTFYYPIILGIIQRLTGSLVLTQDRLLATVYAGILIGVGIGVVIRQGASTGGMDIPPLVLNKKLGLPISASMYAFDFLILLSQMLFADQEQVLYGILLVMIYTVILDKVLLFGSARTQVKIVSRSYREIHKRILQDLDRGVTLLHAQTGYCHIENDVILTVVSNRELSRLNHLVQELDPDAFMIVSQVKEVKGRGFTKKKEYR